MFGRPRPHRPVRPATERAATFAVLFLGGMILLLVVTLLTVAVVG